jgi:hypothetical protein
MQAFLYGLLQQEEEAAALRALAVLTELHRRNVWRDARTVNVIGECHGATLMPVTTTRRMLQAERLPRVCEHNAEEPGIPRMDDAPCLCTAWLW